MSSTSAARRPATRILSCCSGVLIVTVMKGVTVEGALWYKARAPVATRLFSVTLNHTYIGTFCWVPHLKKGLWNGIYGGLTRRYRNGRRNHAPDARGWRALWSSDPLLEPQDGTVHLWRT